MGEQNASFKNLYASVRKVVKLVCENIAMLNAYNVYDEDIDVVESYM